MDENKEVKAIQIFKPDTQPSQSMKAFRHNFDNGSVGGIAYEDIYTAFSDGRIRTRIFFDGELIGTVPIGAVCGGMGGPSPLSSEQWFSLDLYTYGGRLEYDLIVGTEVIPVK